MPALLFRSLSKQRFDAVAHLDHVATYAADSLIAAACIALVSWRLQRQTLSMAALQVHWHSTP